MATARDIVTAALIKIGVATPTEAPTAEDSRDTLAALNRMLFAFKARGADIEHATIGLSDSLLTDEYEEGLIAMLTVRIAGDYGVSVDETTARIAEDGWRQIMNNYSVPDNLEMESGLLRMPSMRLYP